MLCVFYHKAVVDTDTVLGKSRGRKQRTRCSVFQQDTEFPALVAYESKCQNKGIF